MDWYFGSGIDDLVVPKDGELPDRLPSPDSWYKWGMNASESFGSGNKYFVMDEELNFNGKRGGYNAEMEASAQDKVQSSDSSVQRSTLSHGQPDYQLDDLAGIEQMDDILLSSLLDDLPVEDFHRSVCITPGSQNGTTRTDNLSTHLVDSQSNSSNMHSMESSKYARTDASYMSIGWKNGKITPCSSEQKDCPPVKASLVELLAPSEENSTSGYAGEEASLEESVLQELETVMTQLTDQTRICFRDALYRLARNSKQQHMVADNQTGDLLMEKPPPWTDHDDETIRSERKKPMESETNTIDRAVANLMFNEMESNVRNNIPLAVSANFTQEVVQASGSQSYCFSRQICNFPHDQSLSGDAEVPIHGRRELNVCNSAM